eukprot:TRINITY_DN7009_c1_g1_i2.p1 TRINITY_DN7009_c1_g1~~TRINITY_DN7009_c1_g1_i2.p1  ORF type:complete len:650 (+),score=106.17 TRINITY_DN7009_c1_g1_i2:985-2934(+)
MEILGVAFMAIAREGAKPVDLANTAWAFAAVSYSHNPLMAVIAAASLKNISAFNGQDIANIRWSLAKQSFVDKPLMYELAEVSMKKIHTFNPQGISNTAWAYATLAFSDASLFGSLSSYFAGHQKEFDPQNISSLAWAYAAANVEDLPLFDLIACAALARVFEFSIQGLANTAWAFARSGVLNEPLMNGIAAAALGNNLISQFTPQNIANTVWACATILYSDIPLLDALAEAATMRINELGSQGLTNVARAIATLSSDSVALKEAIASISTKLDSNSSLEDVSNTAWSVASLALCNESLTAALSAAAVQSLKYSQAHVPSQGLSADIRNLVQALAAAGCFSNKEALQKVQEALKDICEVIDASRSKSSVQPIALPVLKAGETPPVTPAVLLMRDGACALYKPPGWSVTVGWGSDEYYGEFNSQDRMHERRVKPFQGWVMEHLGAQHPIAEDVLAQHGLVHRLDKDTSGVILCALNYSDYHLAHLQFVADQVTKEYVCLCHGHFPMSTSRLEVPLRVVVGKSGARRSAPGPGGKACCTEIGAVAHLSTSQADKYSLVEVKLHSGRLHQIRAHLSLEGYPLVGDRDYGAPPSALSSRPFLHAHHLFIKLATGPLDVHCALPDDLSLALSTLDALGGEGNAADLLLKKWKTT